MFLCINFIIMNCLKAKLEHHFQVEINHAGEIDEIFDAISYRKGASVIRMLQSYLGAKTFQVSHLCFSTLCKLGIILDFLCWL